MGLILSKQRHYNEADVIKILSAQDTKQVWTRRFGNKEIQVCPVCRKCIMNQKRIPKDNWSVAYVRYYGSNDKENMVPICHKCTLKYNKKKCPNLIDISEGNHDRSIIY